MKIIGLGIISLATIGLLAFGLSRPVGAAECMNYDEEFGNLQTSGHSPVQIPADRLQKIVADAEVVTGDVYSGVTRGFTFAEADHTVIGFEIGGCLIDPVVITKPHAGA